ncbi:dehydrogenase [Lithospermum erythrorhizon]|uniref:CASP-like protein n=1 Tax=Lithospermum erythrorhizon TaxID=34254 RepID=A0AAV3QHI1_LITER
MPGEKEAGEAPKDSLIPPEEEAKGPGRGLSIGDFALRIVAAISSIASAVAMAKTHQSLPSFTQFISFRAEYKDLPTFQFFVVVNGIISAYLVISMLISIFHIVKPGANFTRMILLICDTVMLVLLTAGASAAAAIVHLAHKGNTRANWYAICHQHNSFCERSTGSLVGSFIADLVMLLLVIFSAVSIA